VRVIAGSARGRRLKGPPGAGLRPSGDKVKGAIFSQLEALAYKRGYERIVEPTGLERFAAAQAWPIVLELYAGSGALGIEALSRGAERVEFVESNAAARRLIQANLRLTGFAERALVHPLGTARALSTLPGRYDLILADPPYDDRSAAELLDQLADSHLITESSVLVWEHRAGQSPVSKLGRLHLWRTRRHGIAALSLYSLEPIEPHRSGGNDAEQRTGG
jgi:16S rRNA (guanine(966)-N(2))-methyltransferase RsmD